MYFRFSPPYCNIVVLSDIIVIRIRNFREVQIFMANSLESRVGIHPPRTSASARDSMYARVEDATGGGNIRVAVRIRPFLPNEIEQEHALLSRS